jgi:hypothetical protein
MIFNGVSVSDADLKEIVERARRNSLTPIRGAEASFGARLKQATQQRLFGGCRASKAQTNVSANDDESFAERLRKAVEKHPKSKENAQKNAEKERSRYRRQPRPHTKSD